mmetsp:Transcript_8128/g.22362  ORF Transcript_8128/g.22362 Transcript_8128/m.22362 type:complete len:252 (-) Transcript_8128:1272-2027(-)
MTIEVDALRHLATRNGEEDSTAAAVARALVVLQGERGLHDIGCLDVDQLVLKHAVENRRQPCPGAASAAVAAARALGARRLCPLADHLLHVKVRREEGDHAVGHVLGHLNEELAVGAYGRVLGASLEARAQRSLVSGAAEDEWADTVPAKRHSERAHDAGGEAQELWVELDGRERARGDDHGLEALEDVLDCYGRVEAAELHHWVGQARRAIVGWLEEDGEARFKGGAHGAKLGDEHEGLELLDVGHLEGA